MTSGSIAGKLLTFMLPVAGSSLFQQLYNTADFMFIGNFLTMSAAAAVGASSSIVNLLIGLFSGLSVGVNVHAARSFGEKDTERLSGILHTALTFSLLAGILLALSGIFAAPHILRYLHTPTEAMPEATVYLRIYLLSIPFMVFYNMGAAFLRGKGDASTPFRILALCGLVNVAMDALLVIVIPLGVAGVAIATAASQGLSAALILRSLGRLESGSHFCLCGFWAMLHPPEAAKKAMLHQRFLGIDGRILRDILRIGLPAGIQSVVITFSNIIVQYYINGLGAVSVAAFAVYYKLENFIYLPILAFGQASTTFTAQNYGAGNRERIQKGIWLNTGMGVLVTALLAAIILMFPHSIFRLFMKDEGVIAQAVQIGRNTFSLYWLYVFIEVFGGAIRGMGRSLASMTIVLSTLCGVRILLLYIIAHTHYTLGSIALVYPVTWALAGIAFLVWYMRTLIRLFAG